VGSIPRALELDLEGGAGPLAAGLAYLPEFIDAAEERRIVAAIERMMLIEAPYKDYTAKRRIARFDSIPEVLLPLRDRAAAVLEAPVPHALLTEYSPGTPLGWHRDAPEFGAVFGISLLGAARMRFRRYPPRKGGEIFNLDLAPRSAYTLRGEARWGWQHSIAPTVELRYSITFRTVRPS
jgi:alkylated DNA repair dioxygenase AlkB